MLRAADIMRLKAGGGSDHRWYSFHLAGLWFAMAMRLIPRRRRFGAAMLIARAASPFIRRTEAFRAQRKGNVDGVCEIAFFFILNTLTKNGTVFDPVITLKGYELLERALAEGKGVLALSPHTVLSLLMTRFFYDAGLNPIFIAADREIRLSGTTMMVQAVQPSPTFLVATRSRLREGRLVCAMPDRGEPSEGRTVEFDTAFGRVIVATPLIQVAARCGAKVIFFEVHLEKGGVVAMFAAPAEASAATHDGITEDFIGFIQAHVESRAAYYN